MRAINICQLIQCPYFNEKSQNYGCQRYGISCQCHLKKARALTSTQYALYASQGDEINVPSIKEENNKFFLNDNKYINDLYFQAENPDFFREKDFKVKEIPEGIESN